MIATYSGCWIDGIWVCSRNIHACTSIRMNELSVTLNKCLSCDMNSSRLQIYFLFGILRNIIRDDEGEVNINITRCKNIILLPLPNNVAIHFSSINRNKVKDLIWHFYLVFCIPYGIHKVCKTVLHIYMRTVCEPQWECKLLCKR